MNQKNKRTLFLTSAICIVLSIVTFILSQMGGASAENYILLYVIALLMNIVLNLALSIKIASTNGVRDIQIFCLLVCSEICRTDHSELFSHGSNR